MPSIIPPAFLIRPAIPLKRIARLPRAKGALLGLPTDCRLSRFDDRTDTPIVGDIRAAWNERGLAFNVQVTGRQSPLDGKSSRAVQLDPTEFDGLQLWIDTRGTQTIHRASRYCHHFCLLPAGAGTRSKKPAVVQLPIARARDEAPDANLVDVQLAMEPADDGYLLEAWFPESTLHGFDPKSNPRIGFYYLLRDEELGEQYLTVGPEFPFAHDPSLWATLELTR